MQLDFFSAVIVSAVVGLVAYMVAECAIHRKLESPLNAIMMSLAIGGFVIGCNLIWVAVEGDISKLPPDVWRWHVGFAGIVSIGLSFQKIIQAVQKVFSKSARPQQTKTDDNGG